MTDFAWASMHGFITLVLEGEIGGRDSSRGLEGPRPRRSAAMAETVVRSGATSRGMRKSRAFDVPPWPATLVNRFDQAGRHWL